jgi:penicillin-binding protein 2B
MKKKRRLLTESNRNLSKIAVAMMLSGTLVVANVLFTMTTHIHFWSGQDVLTNKIASSIVNTTVEAKRGLIYDRNYNVIAQEVSAYTIVAYLDSSVTDEEGNPDYVSSPAKTAKALAAVLDGVDASSIQTILENAIENGQVQTELGSGTKRLDKETMEKVAEADIAGIGFVNATNREYPTSPYSSNLIGFAAYDEDTQTISGKMGLEQTLDEELSGKDGKVQYQQAVDGTILPGTTQVYEEAVSGDNVVLTIDSNLQSIVEQQLQVTMEANNASSAFCLVMEPETGKILAWASYPTFDQNTHLEIPSYIDNISEKNMEVGSVMKPFTYAVAIDTGVYNGSATYRAGTFTYTQDSTGKIVRVANGTETEFQPISDALGNDFGTISFDQGLWYSSNVGICELLANYINYNDYASYLKAFGFFQSTETPYVNESLGVENISTASDYLSTGFGQASSITLLQLAQAYTAIFNDGVMMMPYVVEQIIDPDTNTVVEEYSPTEVGQPISAETANTVKDLMRGVLQEGASGEKFIIDGIDMVAKTGTGQLYNENTGTYDENVYTSSIMAAAPADDPKIMVYWGMTSANYLNYSADPFKEIMRAALIVNGISGADATTESTEEASTWETYEMPSLQNHSLAYAQDKLAGMSTSTVVLSDGDGVISQYPAAGATVNSNSRIFLLTDGAGITMPDMTGWTRKDVTVFWSLTGIGIQTTGYGKVTSQNIEAGTPIDGNSDIQVTLE